MRDNAKSVAHKVPADIPRTDVDWSVIDRTTPNIRTVFNEGVLPFHPNEEIFPVLAVMPEDQLVARLWREQHQAQPPSTRAVYGDDHPQAHEVWKPLAPIKRRKGSK